MINLDSVMHKPDKSAKIIVIVDYLSEKNRGDAAIHLGLINILRNCYPDATISAISTIGANQFPKMEKEYDQSNLLGIKVIGGLVPTYYPTTKEERKPTLLLEILNHISLFFRLWLLIALKLRVPVHFLGHMVSKK